MLRVKFGLYNCIRAGDEKLVSVASNCTLSQCDLHVDFSTLCYHIWQNLSGKTFIVKVKWLYLHGKTFAVACILTHTVIYQFIVTAFIVAALR